MSPQGRPKGEVPECAARRYSDEHRTAPRETRSRPGYGVHAGVDGIRASVGCRSGGRTTGVLGARTGGRGAALVRRTDRYLGPTWLRSPGPGRGGPAGASRRRCGAARGTAHAATGARHGPGAKRPRRRGATVGHGTAGACEGASRPAGRRRRQPGARTGGADRGSARPGRPTGPVCTRHATRELRCDARRRFRCRTGERGCHHGRCRERM